MEDKNEIEVTPQLKEQLLKGISDYLDSQTTLCPDNVDLMSILPDLLKLQNEKGLLYGKSYCKRGDISIFMNVERKYDRISNIMDHALDTGMSNLHSESSDTPTETFLDTIVDLGVYALLWTTYIKKMYPLNYEKFLTTNKLGSTCD